MKLHVEADLARATAVGAPSGMSDDFGNVELRKLPWKDGHFSALEVDDIPDPDDWTTSGPAMNECRRVLKRGGLIELRTRRTDARRAQESEKSLTGAMTRLLQNHGFEIVSVDAVEDAGSMISAIALRSDGPEDRFEDEVAALASHLTLHAPMLDAGDDATANRALAVTLDAQGVKVRVRVIFDVLDALYVD